MWRTTIERSAAAPSQRLPRRLPRRAQAYAASPPTNNPTIRLGMLLASSMVACLSASSLARGHPRRFARMGTHANERSRTRRPASCNGEWKLMAGSTSSSDGCPFTGSEPPRPPARDRHRRGGVRNLALAQGLTASADEATPVATLNDTAWGDLASRLSGRLLRPGDAMYPAATMINAARYMGVGPAGIAVCVSRKMRRPASRGPAKLGRHSPYAPEGIPTPDFPLPTDWSSTSKGCVQSASIQPQTR